ncbi:MAG: hypothetical protein AB2L24_04920 [Mangrovibacterium sp.]
MTEVILLDNFKHDAKQLLKKYPSLKNELEQFIETTENKGAQGTSLGGGLFKARLAVKSKGKGKSGGNAGHFLSGHYCSQQRQQRLPGCHV